MGRKSGSKRQASLDARKQILKVRGDYLELSDDEEEDDVVEITEAPAKKYKVTARKSDGERNVLRIARIDAEPTLEMEVWTDELSPAQIAARKAAQSVRDSIQTIIDGVVKENNGRLTLDSPQLTALQLKSFVHEEIAKKAAAAAAAGATASPTTSDAKSAAPGLVSRPAAGRPSGMRRVVPVGTPVSKPTFSVLLDPRVQKPTLASNLQAALQPVRQRIEAPVPKKKAFLKGYTAATPMTTTSTQPPPMIPILRTEIPPLVPTAAAVSAVGGVTTTTVNAAGSVTTSAPPGPRQTVVDLTSDEARKSGGGSSADSKEVAFNKLQGKTFPSLVVVARPSLNIKEGLPDNRPALDRKVKRLLVYPPAQFAEYLIQQGLVKSEHFCTTHPNNKLKLGMYSDAARFPNSGGYIWISECCPPKFLSVFHESLFEGAQLPSTNFKLIYHWACQTNVQNVLQWVKVENIYLKGLYTWLRGVCTVALHTHFPTLGGLGNLVEVGVISLGTTTHDGANRHVKVEVLGVLETSTKRLMLRAVDPNDTDLGRSVKKRFSRILEPLLDWVNPDSTLVIDMTIEKQMLQQMGFKYVVRNGTNSASNQTVMDYLRRIVPRMFQNTLSLLSRQIIQQFLDELVWREIFGTTAYDAFHSIQRHISEQTRVDCGSSLFTRLNKVAANPFRRWSLAQYLKKPIAPKPRLKQYGAASSNSTSAHSATLLTINPPPSPSQYGQIVPRQSGNIPNLPRVAQIPKQLTSLEPYYYGMVDGSPKFEDAYLDIECPLCKKPYSTNTDLMLHLFRHVAEADYFCKYCLMDCGSKHNLYTHLELKHATETKAGRFYNCLICHDKFNSVVVLGKHMSIEHSPSELPYHCADCSYKSSSHKAIIDHFYKKHKQQAALQCPFCLQITYLDEKTGATHNEQTNTFLNHLLAHTKRGKNMKGVVKKCARCDLQFLEKYEFDEHGDRHVCYKLEAGFAPYPDTKHCYLVPKSLRDEELKAGNKNIVEYSLPDTYKCKECGKILSSEAHFKETMFCQKADCKYQTMCKTAMMSHKMMCSLYTKKMQKHPLAFVLFCVCGFTSRDGNVMAGHLAICDRKSAYPSAEAAAKACVMPGMLDVLGLVRKDDSKDSEDVKPVRPETRRRKRRWCLIDVSDNEEDKDDPDFNTSDEEFRPTTKRRRSKMKSATSAKQAISEVDEASTSGQASTSADTGVNISDEGNDAEKDEDDATGSTAANEAGGDENIDAQDEGVPNDDGVNASDT